MSSSSNVTTDDFVPGRKLLVHVAENGHSFEFECDDSTPVEAVQRSIESLCGVQFNDQLLLCHNIALDSQQRLGNYRLPHDDREVFLYNKARLYTDSPRPLDETPDVADAVIPPPPSPSQSPHPLDDATDPALKALASYERQFRYHFQVANAIFVCTQKKFEVCKRLLREYQVQERALETARGNLNHLFRRLNQRYTEFSRYYSQQNRCHSDLLANFGRDVERLRASKLHPALQTENRRCLLDFTKEENLRKWGDCANSHRQFESKVSHLKSNFVELKRKVENVFSDSMSASSRDLELMIRDHQRILNDQKSLMQSLSKDVNTVKKLVDDCLSCTPSASLYPHDAVSALGPMYSSHEKNHLPKMQDCGHAIAKLLDKCKLKKNEMNSLLHNLMQKVARVQNNIKDMHNELHAFKEVMGHQDSDFKDLKFVHGIGPAYRACLAEVVRRKTSMKLYMGLAGQLAERLATEREAEVRRREEFLKTWSIYIPHDILASMGLFDSPSQCDVNIAPFDANLLEIDIVDLDRFAPQTLIGVPSKFERSGVPSNDSCHLNEAEDISVDALEKFDSQELLEGFESVDIAGTSKMEVENAWLKAELASAIALICSFDAEVVYDSSDDSKLDVLKTTTEKTAEALHLKDEYAKHLQSMLKLKQVQCFSYEKRIQELEQRLSDQYLQGQKLSVSKDASESSLSAVKTDGYKSEITGDGEAHTPCISTEPMDEATCTSVSLDPKLDQITEQLDKPREGGDENMTDLSGILNMQAGDSAQNSMDASMLEPSRDEHQVGDVDRDEKMITPQLNLTMVHSSSDDRIGEPLTMLPCQIAAEPLLESKSGNGLVLDLQNSLADKSNQCKETENKLKAAMEEIISLKRDLEVSQKLLDESQMNCAHLENCLHEAREEAHTNLCAAERRASEYSALRTSAVKMRSLFERFRSCVTGSVGVASFADSLRSLALSLASSGNEDEDDGSVDFGACMRVLADKVSFLSRHRAELSDRCSRAEAAHGHLVNELEEKKELIKSLYTKHQFEKQVNKEKISFGRFEVHELAAFVLNSAGNYEAINRNCSNYYLSTESVALFTEHLPSRPTYIIGHIVHIERQIVRAPVSIRAEHGDQMDTFDSGNRLPPGSGVPSSPYGLPIGCEYFIVTVAMLPDTIHSSAS